MDLIAPERIRKKEYVPKGRRSYANPEDVKGYPCIAMRQRGAAGVCIPQEARAQCKHTNVSKARAQETESAVAQSDTRGSGKTCSEVHQERQEKERTISGETPRIRPICLAIEDADILDERRTTARDPHKKKDQKKVQEKHERHAMCCKCQSLQKRARQARQTTDTTPTLHDSCGQTACSMHHKLPEGFLLNHQRKPT
jgi:hypothetical protein